MNRKHEILRRATEIFARKGYADTSLEEIADAVGIKREAIYYYFKNKAQILKAVIRPQSVSLLNGITSILTLEISSSEKLLLALQNHIDRFNPSFLEMSVFARAHHSFDGDLDFTDLRQIWRSYGDSWIKLLIEGQRNGQFIPDLDAKVVAFGILGMCNWLSRWYDPSKAVSVRDVVRIYFRLIGGGLIKNFEDNSRPAQLIDVDDTQLNAIVANSKAQIRSAPSEPAQGYMGDGEGQKRRRRPPSSARAKAAPAAEKPTNVAVKPRGRTISVQSQHQPRSGDVRRRRPLA